MKKLIRILSVSILAVVIAFSFSACSFLAKQAEKRLVEKGEFVADSRQDYKDSTLSIRSDKTYSLHIYNTETKEMESYEGKWSYVMKYKFKYTVTYDPAELIKSKESVTWEIFKLDGYMDRGEQGYFVHKEFGGIIYSTNEEINESHFEQYKEENGLVILPGYQMKTAPKD